MQKAAFVLVLALPMVAALLKTKKETQFTPVDLQECDTAELSMWEQCKKGCISEGCPTNMEECYNTICDHPGRLERLEELRKAIDEANQADLKSDDEKSEDDKQFGHNNGPQFEMEQEQKNFESCKK